MSYGQDALTPWLSRLISDITEAGMVTRFDLCHCIEGEPAERLEQFRCLEGSPRVPDELHREIMVCAEADTASRVSTGPQRYIVQAFRSDRETASAQTAFLVNSRNSRRSGDESEPPTEKGMVSYTMRHAENAYRLLASGTDALVGKLSREIEREHGLRLKAEEACARVVAECQSLLDRASERRLAEARALMQHQRLDQIVGSLVPLVPLFVERLASGLAGANEPKRLAKVEPMTLDQKLQRLFRALHTQELEAMADALKPQNQIVFCELHSQFMNSASTIGARESAMKLFLKGLTEAEGLALFAAIGPGENRLMLLDIYQECRSSDAAEQAAKPEILRS